MTHDDEKSRPIGYWLREADELLTRFTNRVQLSNGVSRYEWQVLNLVHRSPDIRYDQIGGVLLPFMDDQALRAIIARLHDRGWLEEIANELPAYRLTAAGEKQHVRVRRAQQQVRDTAMRGITPDEYVATVAVLQRMVANLRAAADAGSKAST
jgi:DNA-binding MarR family transcriptional regulator